ncbi:MAG: HAD hydrolase family protein [Endomicrobium sp.]|jgi:phosphomannomutase|nr:HAD hydrolase family protein [Endomicrobium sp.]
MRTKIKNLFAVICILVFATISFSFAKEIYVFDIDGTLTPTNQPMTKDFAKWFEKFVTDHSVYLATGADIDKVKLQIPTNIYRKLKGIFASMGNEYYEHDNLVYKKDFKFDEKLLAMLENFRKNTKYPFSLHDGYLELRVGMVYYTTIGIKAPKEEKDRYAEWDKVNAERDAIVKKLKPLYPKLTFTFGSPISINIVPEGCGKEQVADYLRSKFVRDLIIFAADRTEKGGNDYSLAQRLLELGNSRIVPVDNPDDTMEKFKNDKALKK